MLVGMRFGVPGLPCLRDDGTADFGGVGVFLVRFSNEISVPSAFLIISLAARGTNIREPTSSWLAPDMGEVDGVGGGDVKPRLFEECERAEMGGQVDRRGQKCEIVSALRVSE
jgi:hypothetical protein